MAISPAARIISWEMDGLSHIVCGGLVSRQAVGTVRLATRGAARQAGRGEAMGGTKNGTTAIEAIVPCHVWWTTRGSNPRPPACKAVALATELVARIGIYIIYRHEDGNATGKYRLHHICANRRIR